MSDTRLIHVRVPRDIVQALDEIDEGRSRAEKVTAALQEYVRKRRLLDVIESGAASLTADESDLWNSDSAVDAWVRDRRAEYGPDGRPGR